MGVYIKGMEMPKSCNKCPLHFYEGQAICSCRALPAIDDDEILKPWKNRRKDCPLVPVPEHGRLGDLDALIDKVIAKYLNFERNGKLVFAAAEIKQDICDLISDAPTIIPAENGEDGGKL